MTGPGLWWPTTMIVPELSAGTVSGSGVLGEDSWSWVMGELWQRSYRGGSPIHIPASRYLYIYEPGTTGHGSEGSWKRC